MPRLYTVDSVGLVDVDDLTKRVDLRKIVGNGPLRCLWKPERTPSLAIYPDHVYCFGCGCRHDSIAFLRRYYGISFYDTLRLMYRYRWHEQLPQPEAHLPTVDPDLVTGPMKRLWSRDGAEARDWLHDRGLQDSTIRVNHLGWDGRYITIPHICDDVCWNIKKRVLPDYQMEGEPKYIGLPNHGFPCLYPMDVFKKYFKGSKVVFLTEGEFDALILMQSGLPALSLPSGANSPLQKYKECLEGIKTLYLVLDQDAAGNRAASIIQDRAEQFSSVRVKRVTWPVEYGKDITDVREFLIPKLVERYDNV